MTKLHKTLRNLVHALPVTGRPSIKADVRVRGPVDGRVVGEVRAGALPGGHLYAMLEEELST